jgi:hypothetical protein
VRIRFGCGLDSRIYGKPRDRRYKKIYKKILFYNICNESGRHPTGRDIVDNKQCNVNAVKDCTCEMQEGIKEDICFFYVMLTVHLDLYE